MQRISVHITDETKLKIHLAAKAKNKDESEIIRQALDEGLKKIHPKSGSAQALLDFAKLAEQIPTQGEVPEDVVENMDYYTWGGEKNG